MPEQPKSKVPQKPAARFKGHSAGCSNGEEERGQLTAFFDLGGWIYPNRPRPVAGEPPPPSDRAGASRGVYRFCIGFPYRKTPFGAVWFQGGGEVENGFSSDRGKIQKTDTAPSDFKSRHLHQFIPSGCRWRAAWLGPQPAYALLGVISAPHPGTGSR